MFKNLIVKLALKRTKDESLGLALPIRFSWKNIYILPTKNGIIFLALTAATIISSINSNNNLGFLFGFYLLSVFFLTIFKSHLNLKGLKIVKTTTKDAFVSENLEIKFFLETENRKLSNINIEPRRNFLNFKSAFLKKNLSEYQLTTKTQAKKRGKLEFKTFKIYSTYPFGLFQVWSYFEIPTTLYAYPKRLTNKNKAQFRTAAKNKNESKHLVKTTNGTPDSFAFHREYINGDNLKDIDWKLYQNKNLLKVKTHESHANSSIEHIDINSVSGDFEIKLSKLSFLLDQAIKNKKPFVFRSTNLEENCENYLEDIATKCLENLASL